MSRSTSERIFARLRLAAGIKRTDGGRYQPRLHDLRHTAAVHRLVAWYRQGADVQSLLIRLSAYLGHVDIAATQKYLTWTPELRTQASARWSDQDGKMDAVVRRRWTDEDGLFAPVLEARD